MGKTTQAFGGSGGGGTGTLVSESGDSGCFFPPGKNDHMGFIGIYGYPHPQWWLGGGCKYFLFSPLVGEDEPILTNIFQLGWNHQLDGYMSYGQHLVHGEGTSLSRVDPYWFWSGNTLDKPSSGYPVIWWLYGYPVIRLFPWGVCLNSHDGLLFLTLNQRLGGGCKYFLFSPLVGGMIPILTNIFQMDWNHQPDGSYWPKGPALLLLFSHYT